MSPADNDLDELRQLAQEVEPPTEVEERVVAALKHEGLIDESRSGTASWRSRMAIAASLLVAVLGGWFARGAIDRAPTPVAVQEYLLVLSEPHGLATDKPTEQLVAEYADWARGLAREGRLVSARRLGRKTRGLRLASAGDLETTTSWEPHLATGFFLVRADSLEEAAELASDCPHLGYGGEIRVTEVARRE